MAWNEDMSGATTVAGFDFSRTPYIFQEMERATHAIIIREILVKGVCIKRGTMEDFVPGAVILNCIVQEKRGVKSTHHRLLTPVGDPLYYEPDEGFGTRWSSGDYDGPDKIEAKECEDYIYEYIYY